MPDLVVGGVDPATLGLEDTLAFQITVPGSWYEIDLHPATRERTIRELVERRVWGNDALWTQRHAIVRLLTQQARAAYDAGAAYCAAFAIPTEDGPITGAVTVSLVRGPAGCPSAEDRAGQLTDLFTSVPRAGGPDEHEPWSTVSVVEIPSVGTCARSYGIDDVTLDGGHDAIRTVFMETVLPVPDSHQVFLVSAGSPAMVLVEELHDVFDAITSTFRLVRAPEDR